MDAIARMSPADFAYIIGAAALVMLSQALWGWRHNIVGYVTKRRSRPAPATATAPVAATATEALPPVAKPSNEVNEELPRNGGNLVLRAQADIIARLLKADMYIPDGKGGFKELKQTRLIELATGITANGRAESDYGQLRAELEKLINPQLTIAAGRPEERQIAKVSG
jgi:hypothetical protein